MSALVFKKGDRVIVVNNNQASKLDIGDKGTVMKIALTPMGDFLYVKLDKDPTGTAGGWTPSRFEFEPNWAADMVGNIPVDNS